MSHAKPHLDRASGLCDCDCPRCTVPGTDVCCCADCDARKCGLHVGLPRSPRPTPLGPPARR